MKRKSELWFIGTRSQVRVNFILAIFALIVSLIRMLSPWLEHFIHQNYEAKQNEFSEEFSVFLQNLENTLPISDTLSLISIAEEMPPAGNKNLFKFNPNTLSYDSLILLGLNKYVASNIMRYRKAGGVFIAPEDINRVYGMDSITGYQLIPYINIPTAQIINPSNSSGKQNFKIDLNNCTAADLRKIPLVSYKLSGTIIRYRDLLGGFFSHQQLQEVYGMTDSAMLALSLHTYTDTSRIKRISLKTATFQEMIRHPYLNETEVKAILQLREYYEDKIDFEMLKEEGVIPDTCLFKLRPYLR